MKKIIILICTLLFSSHVLASPQLSSLECKKNARADAKKLLSFYRNNDDRIEIDDNVKALPKIKNPANPSQTFDVIEVWGHIYKGQYRMRLTYFTPIACTLLGEDILEYAKL